MVSFRRKCLLCSLGFKNYKYPNRVYNLSKALYGLKQALQAWYASLKTFLVEHVYVMKSVDKTLFTLLSWH
jgi:hypothetical protein